jgi:hypothetical protein
MRSTPTECREHAERCLKTASISPPALANEFRKLAQKWMRLGDDLEPAQASTESPSDPLGNVVALRRVGWSEASKRVEENSRKLR